MIDERTLEAVVDDLPDLYVEMPPGVRIGAPDVPVELLDVLERDQIGGYGRRVGRPGLRC